MRTIFLFITLLFFIRGFAQESAASDIVLNAVVIQNDTRLPDDAKDRLRTKLAQIASENGVSSIGINPRFVIAAKVNINTKDIVPGPPQMIAMNLELVFFVGDAATSQVYSTTTLEQKGVGTNENKAFLNAIQQLNVKNKLFVDFVATGKNKIKQYYQQNCDQIITNASALGGLQKYQEAIYELVQIPAGISPCMEKALPLLQRFQQQQIDLSSKKLYNQAVAIWASNPTGSGANEVARILRGVHPLYTDIEKVRELVGQIGKKMEEVEKREWDFKLLEYDNSIKLEQQRIEAAKATAIEYHRSRPDITVYNYNKVYWW